MSIKNQEALEKRADKLEANNLNGIRLVLVTLHPKPDPTEARLEVHFYNNIEIANILNETSGPEFIFRISGGHRINAGPASDQVKPVEINGNPAGRVLTLTVKPIGDYSTYRLRIEYKNIDPLFGEIDFKFRPECFNTNCAPTSEPAPEPNADPSIDYLAKDYDSFKHVMMAAMMERVPGWQPSSEADLDQVLLELFSAAADELSDHQDRVMNEAYLLTARKRVSLARHARLMDYHIHQGNQASTWLALTTDIEDGVDLHSAFTTWTADNTGAPPAVFISREKRHLLFGMGLEFQGDLDSETFTDNLRGKFESFGIILLQSASVSIRTPGSEWLVRDDTPGIYSVRKEEKLLNVYLPRILHPLLNQVRLYTWSGAIPALKAQSTTADLRITDIGDKASAEKVQNLIRKGDVTHFLVQEWLDPSTGKIQGKNPAKRQLLRLLQGEKGATAMQDPFTGEWFVRVSWEEKDKLNNNYCFEVDCPALPGKVENISLFHGNLIKVYHGRPANAVFKEPGTQLNSSGEFHFEREHGDKNIAICRLPQGPLAYRDTPPGGDSPPESTLEIDIVMPGGGSRKWQEKISLIHSDGSDDHFVVETDEEGRSLIRFGNGINGKELPDGAEVRCSYQIGRGEEGNIGADKLSNFDRSVFPEIEGCWNPFNVINGTSPEPVAEIIRRVPEAYRFRQLRAVTLGDYENRAKELPSVSNATARYAWTGSWRTVRITIDPLGTETLDEKLRKEIESYLDAVRLIGEDLEIRPPLFVPLEIHVLLCVNPGYLPEHIRDILEQEFSDGFTPSGGMGFFHPDRWTFGQPLRTSQITGLVQSVEGVDHVIEVRMKRWGEATPGTEDIIELRHNEIFRVRNDPDHMENGFIDFDIRGGRQ